MLTSACGPVAPDEQPASTGSGSSGTGVSTTTGAPATTTGTSPTTTADDTTPAAATTTGATGDASSGPAVDSTGTGTTSGAPDDTCGFICESTADPEPCGGCAVGPDDDATPRCSACDVFAQDCPEGAKCAALACGNGSWNSVACVPVTGDGAPGEPCTAPDGKDGHDDCRKGAMCWDVDAQTHMGVCVELCTGFESSPVCSNETDVCVIENEGVLNLCLPKCDPLIQDCAGDDLCLPVGAPLGEDFVCAPDASGDMGQAFDPCGFKNSCDRGLFCANPFSATECDPDAGNCCTPFCDITAPDPMCPGVGQSCVSIHSEGMVPPEYANVGLCALPP